MTSLSKTYPAQRWAALIVAVLVVVGLWTEWRLLRHTDRAADIFRLDRLSASKPQARVKKSYQLRITAGAAAPDGVERPMLFINGQYPGPLIEAVAGDTLHITVSNDLPSNTTDWDGDARDLYTTRVGDHLPPGTESDVSIHWHGLSMRGFPDMDGAPGWSGAPIRAGGSAVYEFIVADEDVGTHWYHSHVGMQRSDGLFGALVVHPRKAPDEVHSDQVVLLGDHYHKTGIHQLSWFLSRHSLGFEPTPDTVLINGRGKYDCSLALDPSLVARCDETHGAFPEFTLPRGATSRLRLVNVGAVAHLTFAVDGHTLTVTEADGTPIVPFTTTSLSIGPGQRYDVLITADQKEDTFWMRARMDRGCFNIASPSTMYEALGVVRYTSRSGRLGGALSRTRATRLPTTTPWPRQSGADATDVPCHDVPMHLLRPRTPPFAPIGGADIRTSVTVSMPKLDENGLVPVSYMNRTTWRHGHASLLEAFRGADLEALRQPAYPSSPFNPLPQLDYPYDPHAAMVIHSPPTETDTWIELVINNFDEAPHPFHLHGHKFTVLASSESEVGWGDYEDSSDTDGAAKQTGPVVRDTFSVPRRGWAKFQWKMDNPGVWAFHCHVLVHMVSGMALAVVDRPDVLVNL